MNDKKLTQKELADILGVSQPVVSEVVRGLKNVPQKWIDKLTQHYGSMATYYFKKSNVSFGDNNESTMNIVGEPQTICNTTVDILKDQLDRKDKLIDDQSKQISTLLEIIKLK